MRRSLTLLLAMLCCISCLAFPATATEKASNNSNEVLVSSVHIDLPDGGYIIEEITEVEVNSVTRATSTKSGSKTSTRYTASDTAIFAVKVTGTFSYTGSSSWATSSAATVYTYVSGASFVSKSASYSGNTATATGTVEYLGFDLTRTVNLSCDENGNLS
ncbi:MAG: hypothetical protein ACI4P4_11085 [Faecousia sp.]